MGFPVPSVEAPHDRNPFRIRSPHREVGAGDVIQVEEVAPQFLIEVEMASFIEEINIVLSE
jgi:hypothetical protein